MFEYLCFMWNKNDVTFFRKSLLDWYATNQRVFPWRKEGVSNYELILSEILLQRTKAETVARFYNTFFGKYPDWQNLLSAKQGELERILKPLGLNKHRAARLMTIIQEIRAKGGLLPKNRMELQESSLSTLYTANAYELFVLNHRKALLDVNMSRVLRRFFHPKDFEDVRKDMLVQDLAHNVINVRACKELNWAILDFASLICKSTKPVCASCILKARCKFLIQQEDKAVQHISEEFQYSMAYDSSPSFNNENKPLKVLSLFSGCGGMDLGFEGDFIVHRDSVNEILSPDFIKEMVGKNHVRLNPTSFQTVFANAILQEARNSWVNYFKNKGYSPEVFHVGSIVDLVKQHRNGIEVFPRAINIVTGGFPCQDFSLAGKRKGFESHKDHAGKLIKTENPTVETRGQLYMWLKEVVEITKPNIFIAENVKGLVNLSNVKDIIQKDFSTADENGYLVLNPVVLHAANFGVPQSRERVIFVGIKKSALRSKALKELTKEVISDDYNPYPKPSHSFSAQGEKLKPPVKLSSIFRDLPEPEYSSDPSQQVYSKAKFMGKHCQGQNEINLNGIGPTIRSEHHGNIEFRRLSLENGGKIADEILKKKLKERRLTPRECALIQTFPPDYEFVIPSTKSKFFISSSSAYKLIGNAVPPLLAYHIAKRLEKIWQLYFKS